MLKNIPKIISPELMKVLLEMGHGDEILLADGNYPSHSTGVKVVRLDGHGIPEILTAILKYLPLDTFVEENVLLMDNNLSSKPEIWKSYEEILYDSNEDFRIKVLERFKFYERARNVYAIVATSESALYANIILKKGVVKT
ncbi:fucose isomerase [Petrotoga mexicana DSM 14811]|uniref:Fucose isomerase n=1 Tax=Petrotoga mexicana DSM 14811 TaxID=1122954 RepID=A0A2K1P8T6_9BACT|nr:RbsD/FucU domain-containing protein [Petrotoga mexicana]PNR99201.1 fucose isomerase [Petrotoga mexicana DSM 14811]